MVLVALFRIIGEGQSGLKYFKSSKIIIIMLRNYWKRFLLFALFVWPVMLVHGQFNIVLLPAGNIYLKSQLWNLSVSNTSTSAADARIYLEMKDIQTHQTVLSALSVTFNVSPGVRVLQVQSMEPIVYTYGPGTIVDRSSNGMLPVGRYRVCYQLILGYGEHQTAAADDCEEIEVEPLSPPLLTMPENDSVLIMATPDFTWTPPAPITLFNDLNYDLLISPVYNGQSITDAIQKNLPVQQAQGLRQPFFSYPLQGSQLEEGKVYVWQVIARDRQQYAAKSDVWSFRMPDKQNVPVNNNLVYLLMDGQSNGIGVIEPGILHIKYVSSTASHETPIVLRDENGVVLQSVQREIRQGDNYLHIQLNRRFQSKHSYSVVIEEKGNKTNSLAFTIK